MGIATLRPFQEYKTRTAVVEQSSFLGLSYAAAIPSRSLRLQTSTGIPTTYWHKISRSLGFRRVCSSCTEVARLELTRKPKIRITGVYELLPFGVAAPLPFFTGFRGQPTKCAANRQSPFSRRLNHWHSVSDCLVYFNLQWDSPDLNHVTCCEGGKVTRTPITLKITLSHLMEIPPPLTFEVLEIQPKNNSNRFRMPSPL